MIKQPTIQQNQLLAALPAPVLKRLLPYLELVSLTRDEVLYAAGRPLQHVFFPTTAIASILYISENGSSDELAMVGNEGLIGICVVMGTHCTNDDAVVQTAGYAYRLKASILKQELDRTGGRRSGALQNLLLRYSQALLAHMGQTAVCNRHHSVEKQLCRRLLLTLDRIDGNELDMTQESIANMLGVRREGITEAAGKLQRAGLINYHRGHITVLDREKLEANACECYRTVKKEYDRLLSEAPPAFASLPPLAANLVYISDSKQKALR